MDPFQATFLDSSSGYDAENFDAIDSWLGGELITAPSSCNTPQTVLSTPSLCFGGSPCSETETSWFENKYLDPNLTWELWPLPGPCQGSDFRFQTPSSSHIESGGLGYVRFEPERGNIANTPSTTSTSKTTTTIQYECDWPKCKKTSSFSSVDRWKGHLKIHAQDVRNEWTQGSPCRWYGCPSKAKHKTTKIFEDHIKNIHINPLVCIFQGCKHTTPFRGKADLQRHINSVHLEGGKLKCPFPCCRTGRDFSRKDKLMMHLREFHDTDPCPFNRHCNVVLNPEFDSTAKHIGKLHGEFECGLGSCKGSVSQFCESEFLEHLQLDHKMGWSTVLKAKDIAKSMGNQALRDEHVISEEVYDCNICADRD